MARRQRAFQAARHRGRGLRAPAPPRRGAVGDPPQHPGQHLQLLAHHPWEKGTNENTNGLL